MADTITGTVYGEYSKDWRLRVDYTATPNYSTLNYTISAKLYIYKPFSTRSWNLDGSPYYRLLSNTNRTFRFDFNSGIGWYQIGSAQTATASAGSYTITAYWYFDLSEESYRPLSLSLSKAITLPTIGVASQPSVKNASSGGSTITSSPIGTYVYIQSNTASSTFRHKVTYDIGSLTGQTAGLDSDATTGFINWTGFRPPIELIKQLDVNNGDKKTVTINMTTYSDNTYSQVIGTKTTTFSLTGTGYVSIDNGSSFDNYIAFVDNGSGWDRVLPYVDDGSNWNLY